MSNYLDPHPMPGDQQRWEESLRFQKSAQASRTANLRNPPVETELAEIPGELRHLHSELAAMDKLLISLEERLAPIMSPQTEGIVSSPVNPTSPTSGIGAVIREAWDKAAVLNQRLSTLRLRLCI